MSTTPFAENLRGIVAINACNFLFLINDALIKIANEAMPLTQIMFLRGVLSAAILAPIIWWTGGFAYVGLLRNWAVAWRTLAEILAAVFFLMALFNIPIANANAILQAVPLIITAAGAVFLGETVGWRRWAAIIVGFVGVLTVVRPGLAGFTVFSLAAVAAAFAITLRDMTTRIMPRALPATLVAFVTSVAVSVSGPALAPVFGDTWITPDPRSLGLIATAVVFLIGGYLTAVDFMRHGDIAVIAPFRYTVIVMAMVVGYIGWGDVPDLLMIVGTAVIAAAGIYTFSRERNLARLREEAAAGEGL